MFITEYKLHFITYLAMVHQVYKSGQKWQPWHHKWQFTQIHSC